MRFIRLLLLLVLLGGALYYIYDINDATYHETQEAKEKHSTIRHPKEHDLNQPSEKLEGDMYGWMGQSTSELKNNYGEPVRMDKSKYGYTWWIYNDLESTYVQFGVKDDIIQTIYVTGKGSSLTPLNIQESAENIQKDFSFESEISFEKDNMNYTFHLTEDDLVEQPLIKINNDLFMQIYMDSFEHSLIAVRLVSAHVLLSIRPYELTYQGSLTEETEPSKEEWEDMQSGMEQQIFDITNGIRSLFEKDSLHWDDTLHQVAFLHSKDMANENYFAHVSPNGDGLKERLKKEAIVYRSAGENIAADYIDGPAVVSGWLNSKGHREILLQDDFTELGVGVYRNYYTQNYLK